MRKFLYIIIVILLLFAEKALLAQQVPLTSQVYINPLIYNPAEIGKHNYASVYFQSRKQWVGMPGSPESYLLSVDGALDSKRVGLAGFVINDVTDIVQNLNAMAGYRYMIAFDDRQNHLLYLGMSAGMNRTSINFDKLRIENISDRTLFTVAQSNAMFDANLGLAYNWKELKVGISINHLLGNSMTFTDQVEGKSLKYRLIRHFFGNVSYRKKLNREFDLEPSIMIKSSQGMPLQFDLGSYVNYRNFIWLGATYMHQYGVSISLGGLFYHRYTLSYSYDIVTGSISRFTGGSHEILLGVKLFTPRNDENGKPLPDPDDDVERLKRYTQEHFEEIGKLQSDNKNIKKDFANTTKDIESQKEELNELRGAFLKDSGAIQDVIKKYKEESLYADKGNNKMRVNYLRSDSAFIDTTINSNYKKLTYYVVLGTFLKLRDARMFQRIIMRELEVNTVLINQEKDVYLVCSKKFVQSVGVRMRINSHIRDLEKKGAGKLVNGEIWVYKTRE